MENQTEEKQSPNQTTTIETTKKTREQNTPKITKPSIKAGMAKENSCILRIGTDLSFKVFKLASQNDLDSVYSKAFRLR